jgi:tetratricopeptide (TPR) repeat protein
MPDNPARYVLQGSVRLEGEKLRLSARLVSSADQSVVWANSYDKNLKVQELIATQSDIARQVATAIAQPYGIIFHADAARMGQTPPNDWTAYACTLAYYAYRANLGPKTHRSVMQCLQQATEQFPGYATAWALLSLTYLDEVRFRYFVNAGPSPPIDRALDAARRAVHLDPQNMRALQAYMTSLFFNAEANAALKVGAQAMSINPNDTEFVGEYGMRLALTGDWQKGRDLMLQALDRNPGPLGYYESVIALTYYMQSDYRSAEEWIRKGNLQDNPIYHLIAAAIFGQLGQEKEAALAREWLLTNAPGFLTELPRTVKLRNIRPEDQAHFFAGLRKAGLPGTGL